MPQIRKEELQLNGPTVHHLRQKTEMQINSTNQIMSLRLTWNKSVHLGYVST